MEIKGMEGLPAWLQVLSSIAVFVGMGLVGAVGYAKRTWDKKGDPDASKDAVVISASFADSKVIDGLRKSMTAVCEHVQETNRLVEHTNDALADLRAEQARTSDNTMRVADELRRLADELRRGRESGPPVR